jgi:hypothetical protein
MLKIWEKFNHIERFIIIGFATLLTIIGLARDAESTISALMVLLILFVLISFFSTIDISKEKDNVEKINSESNDLESEKIELTCNLNIEAPYVSSSSGDQVLLKDDYIFISKGKRSRIANCLINNTWEAIDAVDLKIPLDVITVINYRDSGMYKGYLEFVYQGFNIRPRDIIKHLQENIVTFNTNEEAKKFLAFKEIVEDRIKELKNQNKNSSLSIADEIKKLADLKEQGILTEEEFLLQKKKLMGL